MLIHESSKAPRMSATVFEFQYRDLIIRMTYLAAVLCYSFDSQMTGALAGKWLAAQVGIIPESLWTRAVLLAGVGVVFVAVLLRTWATSYLRYDIMRNPKIHTDRLICEGPFQYLRNPLYLGNLLMVVGVIPMLSRTGAVVLVVGSVLFICRLVNREEAEMQRTHGQSFREYCHAVPRWIPSTRISAKTGKHAPSFADGIAGELLLWIITVALAAYALTFDLRLFGIIFLCAFIPGASRRMQRLRQRRNA
jgi:protein-S-isoprenylcysteine O-methyltransferase Ste14